MIKQLLLVVLAVCLLVSVVSAEPRLTVDGCIASLDGRPHIPHGMIHVDVEQYDQLRRIGINTIAVDMGWDKFDPQRPLEKNREAIQWLKRMADEAHEHGINFILMFSPHYRPGWLDERYPDLHMLNYEGEPTRGGFILDCFSHPDFRREFEIWVRFLVTEFKDHPAVIGWMLWNEPHLSDPVDYHPYALAEFTKWLQEQHGTIKSLNDIYGTDYVSFADVKAPRPRETYWTTEYYDQMISNSVGSVDGDGVDLESDKTNQALFMDWNRFRQWYLNDFFTWQSNVIRSVDPEAVITSKIVSYELYSSHAAGSAINAELWTDSFLDIVGFDMYPHLDDNFLSRWKSDYIRSIANGKPAWHTEFNFTFVQERGLPTAQQWRSAFFYQLSRGVTGFYDFMWGEPEVYQLHYNGYRPAPVTYELERVSDYIKKLAPIMQPMEPERAKVAVLHSGTSMIAMAGDYTPTADQAAIVSLLYRNQTPFDFVTEKQIRNGDLRKYRALITSGVVALPDDVLAEIKRWTLHRGGHVWANARFAMMDEYGRPRNQADLAWLGFQRSGFHREDRQQTGVLELQRTGYNIDSEPMDLNIKLETWSSKPINLEDGSTTASGDIYGDQDSQFGWTCQGKHELYWEDIQPVGEGKVVGSFEDGSPAIVETPQTIYVARDTCWLDDRFEDLFREWLEGSGVFHVSVAIDPATGKPSPHVDVRTWIDYKQNKTLVFVTNSAPTLKYDGEPVEVELVMEASGELTNPLTGNMVHTKWMNQIRRSSKFKLKSGEVRVFYGMREMPAEHVGKNEIMEHVLGKRRPKPYSTVRRKGDELWVYDARPEFGIGMHGVSSAQMDLMMPIGAKIIRNTVYWDALCNSAGWKEGNYHERNLAEFDQIVKDAKERGLEMCFVVHGDPDGFGWERRHEAYQYFKDFMVFLVKRAPEVKYWELFNEMDTTFGNLFGAHKRSEGYNMFERGRCYCQMLKIVYPAMKEANPNVQIIVGGNDCNEDFLRGMYSEGARDYYDIMAIHTYGVPVIVAMVQRGYHARETLTELGDEGRPLWNTEWGVDAGNIMAANRVTDARDFDKYHLAEWKACIEFCLKTGLFTKYLPYQFQAGNERGFNEDGVIYPQSHTADDYGFGLIRNFDEKTPRPTYTWLAENNPNALVHASPDNVRHLVLNWDGTWYPIGYEYDAQGDSIIIKNVPVNLYVPTVIKLAPK